VLYEYNRQLKTASTWVNLPPPFALEWANIFRSAITWIDPSVGSLCLVTYVKCASYAHTNMMIT